MNSSIMNTTQMMYHIIGQISVMEKPIVERTRLLIQALWDQKIPFSVHHIHFTAMMWIKDESPDDEQLITLVEKQIEELGL